VTHKVKGGGTVLSTELLSEGFMVISYINQI